MVFICKIVHNENFLIFSYYLGLFSANFKTYAILLTWKKISNLLYFDAIPPNFNGNQYRSQPIEKNTACPLKPLCDLTFLMWTRQYLPTISPDGSTTLPKPSGQSVWKAAESGTGIGNLYTCNMLHILPLRKHWARVFTYQETVNLVWF